MKFSIEHLVLETTRKCNMKCRHCLRGNAQQKDMSLKVLFELLSHVDRLWSVTFTGGEPTLNMNLLRGFLYYIKCHNIPLGNFYIVTNGKVFRRELVTICNELYDYSSEKDMCTLAVSEDKFHREYQGKNFEYNKQRYMYDIYGENRPYAYPDAHVYNERSSIINRGRAKTNGLGTRDAFDSEPLVFCEYDDNPYIKGIFYVSVDGNIVNDCNLPYEDIDKSKYNIFKWYKFVQDLPREEV